MRLGCAQGAGRKYSPNWSRWTKGQGECCGGSGSAKAGPYIGGGLRKGRSMLRHYKEHRELWGRKRRSYAAGCDGMLASGIDVKLGGEDEG